MKSAPADGRTGARDHPRRWARPWRDAVVVVAAVLVAGLAGGCALGKAAKAEDETKAPPDSPAALRQDVDRLRADLAGLRKQVETAQRAGTEHADRVAQETRAEFDAVQRAMEASSRHDLQRQVEVLDAQARRIDLLERRAAELGQALRRVELSLNGLESQLARVLDSASAPPPTGARGGLPGRSGAASPGARSAGEPAPAAPPPESAMSSPAAGSDLTPPAMLGPPRPPRSSPPSGPTGLGGPAREATAGQAKVDAGERPPADDAAPAAKRTETSREAKAPSPGTGAKTATPGRSAGATPPGSATTGTSQATPGAGSPTARVLFERGMESWNKGEQGQAVLDFEELVQTFPSDPLAAPAQFRIGEAYYTARDFERAAVEYRKAVELAPKGKETPRALLRLGLAYRAQKREADARQAWSQLVRDFPESDATEEARRALRGR